MNDYGCLAIKVVKMGLISAFFTKVWINRLNHKSAITPDRADIKYINSVILIEKSLLNFIYCNGGKIRVRSDAR